MTHCVINKEPITHLYPGVSGLVHTLILLMMKLILSARPSSSKSTHNNERTVCEGSANCTLAQHGVSAEKQLTICSELHSQYLTNCQLHVLLEQCARQVDSSTPDSVIAKFFFCLKSSYVSKKCKGPVSKNSVLCFELHDKELATR